MFFKILFNLHAFVTGIVGISLVINLVRKPTGSGPKRKEIKISVLLFLLFGATLYLAWFLKQRGNETIGTIILAVVWVLIIIGILYALSKVRWN